jgi:hypothetical protein
MRSTILWLIHDKRWTAKDGSTKLQRLLLGLGHTDVPSRDTLGRLISDMHAETGEPELLLKRRVRRKPAAGQATA